MTANALVFRFVQATYLNRCQSPICCAVKPACSLELVCITCREHYLESDGNRALLF